MSGKHTPAPWVLTISSGVVEDTEHTIAEIGTTGKYRGAVTRMQSCEHIDGICRDELIANARLIVAAPDLLAMLKVAQLWLDADGRFDMQGINAAIAKAEGV